MQPDAIFTLLDKLIYDNKIGILLASCAARTKDDYCYCPIAALATADAKSDDGVVSINLGKPSIGTDVVLVSIYWQHKPTKNYLLNVTAGTLS